MGRHPDGPTGRISVVIPTLNEATTIGTTLEMVARVRGLAEVVVVDGGSTDGTQDLVRSRAVRLIEAPRGRGLQMHAGAAATAGEGLWFLHADTLPPEDASDRIAQALCDPAVVGGHFSIRFDGGRRAARVLTWLYPHLRWLGLCYGDSGFFVRRSAYERAGGFRPYPIFEDLDLLRRLRRLGRLSHLSAAVVTSSRRFEGRSFMLTLAWWSVLQVLYWLGIRPRVLGRLYAPIRGRELSGREHSRPARGIKGGASACSALENRNPFPNTSPTGKSSASTTRSGRSSASPA